jgi:hypothetical protein
MNRENAALTKLKAYINQKEFSTEMMDEHWRELTSKNDRLLAILAGTAIEQALKGVLKKQMPSLSGSLEKSIFGFKGPVGSLSGKADMAAALGLISPNVHRNVDYIREIRNAFAHSLYPLRFTKPEVKAVCDLIVYSDVWRQRAIRQKSYRKKFLWAFIDTGRAIWGHHAI